MAKNLTSHVYVDGVLYGPDSDVPAEVAKRITNPNAWGGDEQSDDGGYSDMKVDDLKAEIERRNEGREEDDQLSTEGKMADLVAVLEDDDNN